MLSRRKKYAAAIPCQEVCNGTARQSSDLSKPIWSTAGQIAKLSESFELKAGDIIYSGTPENVGPVVKGDVLVCKLEGLPDMYRDRLSSRRPACRSRRGGAGFHR